MAITTESEEFEIIPVSPLRKLERKIEELEARLPLDNREIFKEIVSVIRLNQEIVNELVKSTNELKSELAKLPVKIDELVENLKQLIDFIKASAEEEAAGVTADAMHPVVEKLDRLIEQNKKMEELNESLLNVLDALEKRLRRPTLPQPSVQQPTLLKRTQTPTMSRRV
ncbi:MAG: hypothetical protein J7K98_03525 [Candidatus Aenigmarchaeota archaeon]|nr:hypothetical protein [Candidatus Aenigmarchaeota archaeon]